jgi:hypothetical protein
MQEVYLSLKYPFVKHFFTKGQIFFVQVLVFPKIICSFAAHFALYLKKRNKKGLSFREGMALF